MLPNKHAVVLRGEDQGALVILNKLHAGRTKCRNARKWSVRLLRCGSHKTVDETNLQSLAMRDHLAEVAEEHVARLHDEQRAARELERAAALEYEMRAAARERQRAAEAEDDTRAAAEAEDAAIAMEKLAMEELAIDDAADDASNAPTRPPSTPPGSPSKPPSAGPPGEPDDPEPAQPEIVSEALATLFGLHDEEELCVLVQPSRAGLLELGSRLTKKLDHHVLQLDKTTAQDSINYLQHFGRDPRRALTKSDWIDELSVDELIPRLASKSLTLTPRQTEHIWQRAQSKHAALVALLPTAVAAAAALKHAGMLCNAKPSSDATLAQLQSDACASVRRLLHSKRAIALKLEASSRDDAAAAVAAQLGEAVGAGEPSLDTLCEQRAASAAESRRAIHVLLASLSATSDFAAWSEPVARAFGAIPVSSMWADGEPAAGEATAAAEATAAEEASLMKTIRTSEARLRKAWATALVALEHYKCESRWPLKRLREALEAASNRPCLWRSEAVAPPQEAEKAAPGVPKKMSKAARRRAKRVGDFEGEYEGAWPHGPPTPPPPPPPQSRWAEESDRDRLLAPLASGCGALKAARATFGSAAATCLQLVTTNERDLLVALRTLRARSLPVGVVREPVGSNLQAVLSRGLASSISEDDGGVLTAVHRAATLTALHDGWQQLYKAYAVDELSDAAAGKARVAALAAELEAPVTDEREDVLLRQLAHARTDLVIATRQRERGTSAGGAAQEREDVAAAAVAAAGAALSQHRLQRRVKRHELEQAMPHFPEERPRLRALSSALTEPLLRSLRLPRRELDDYDSPPPHASSSSSSSSSSSVASANEEAVLTHRGARRRSDGRAVVLKGYTTDGDLEQERRLCRELRSLSSAALLHCPNLLHPSAVAAERGGHRLWLEYADADSAEPIIEHVDGLRGAGVVEHAGGLGASGLGVRVHEATRELMRQTLTALNYMHERAIAHKNLTPDNLLVSREGRLLLANFELSGAVEAQSSAVSADAAGFNPLVSPPTPAPIARARQRRSSFAQRRSSVYASPEQERGEPLGTPSDIFQLGTVLHYLVCRRHFKPMCTLQPTGRSVDPLLGAMLRDAPSSRARAERLLATPYFSESTVGLLASEGALRDQLEDDGGSKRVLEEITRHRSSTFDYDFDVRCSFRLASTNILKGGLDAFQATLGVASAMRRKIHVHFTDQRGSDAGGLTSEFYTKLWEAIVDPANGLFEGGQDGLLPVATRAPDVLARLQTVGGVLAKTVYDGRRAAPGLSLALFKFLRHTPMEPTMHDVIAFDKQLATSLNSISSCNDEDVASLCLEFERADGTTVAVDASTRDEYLRTRPRDVCVDSRLDAMVHLRDGFALACVALSAERSPPIEPLYDIFSRYPPVAVRNALCDLATVTAAAVLAITRGSSTALGERKAWLVAVIGEMGSEQLRDLLYFATAARCLPSAASTGGDIHFADAPGAGDDHLPVAHTCSNRVDLPRYTSREKLRDKLLQAISISREQGGFQFA